MRSCGWKAGDAFSNGTVDRLYAIEQTVTVRGRLQQLYLSDG